MQVSVKKIKIFKLKNRKGYGCVCLNHLTEGRSIAQAYDRMLKALRRNKIALKRDPSNLKNLITSL